MRGHQQRWPHGWRSRAADGCLGSPSHHGSTDSDQVACPFGDSALDGAPLLAPPAASRLIAQLLEPRTVPSDPGPAGVAKEAS